VLNPRSAVEPNADIAKLVGREVGGILAQVRTDGTVFTMRTVGDQSLVEAGAVQPPTSLIPHRIKGRQ
jgi:hypothetical protein